MKRKVRVALPSGEGQTNGNSNPDEEESERVLPSPKKRVKTNGDSKKPPPFSKVWSDEDEISILRGIIKFKEETGHDARQNMAEFRAFILESLNLSQLDH
ncbi:hypothetical protein HAX54_048571 [Datura stramonium]|uniref:Glabrous enhancer-binding protein-like DBD domain-containing protein n=1 Tax=Datura stramonium TaxID=4076 RepID=A0ABS8WLW0_DATST|nr:hypothetical protein [Datura stramonium]